MKTKRVQLLVVYGIAVAVCLISYTIFLHLQGSRGSLLLWAVYVLANVFGRSRTGYPNAFGVVLASLTLAVPFVGDLYLLQRSSIALKIVGFTVLLALLLATLYWGSTPVALYDPMPNSAR